MRSNPTLLTCVQCGAVKPVPPNKIAAGKKYCSNLCRAASMRGPKVDPIARFWERVNKDGPTPTHLPDLGPCWLWLGAIHTAGYGTLSPYHPERTTHRYSWLLSFGPIPEGLWVLHRCDTRRCVRPDHLFLGTVADNNADMASKGRAASGDRTGPRLHPDRMPRGEEHWARRRPDLIVKGTDRPQAKLTPETVRTIRAAAGTASQSELARRYGVSRGAIRKVIANKSWAHID